MNVMNCLIRTKDRITAADPDMAAADRTEISFKEEDHSFNLYFFQPGTASFDVTFLTKDGDVLETAALLVSVNEVPDWSPEELLYSYGSISSDL